MHTCTQTYTVQENYLDRHFLPCGGLPKLLWPGILLLTVAIVIIAGCFRITVWN